MSVADLDKAIADRDDASMRLHWHLTRAADFGLHKMTLGMAFEAEMMGAERARNDWHAAQAAIFGWNPKVSADAG